MVYVIPSDLAAVMRRSHTARYVADAFYNGQPTLSNMPVSHSGSIDGSAGSRIQTTAKITIESNDIIFRGDRKTIAPEAAVDALATYGQEIVLSRQIWFGDILVGTIPCGQFRITSAPTIAKYGKPFGAGYIYTAVGVELELSDRFEPIDAADFTTLQTPRGGATMWSEVRRFSPFPVVVDPTIPDQTVAKTMVYESSRLDAITDLFALAKAEPMMTRTGSLSGRLMSPTATPISLTGTIKPFTRAMSNDFKNHIVVTTTIDGAAQVLAESMITSGPLRWNGPAGDRVEHVDSGLVSTRDAARNLADARLAAAIRGRKSEVKFDCLPNGSIELGDQVSATDRTTGESVSGIVSDYTLPMDPTDLMSVTIATEVLA